MSIHEHTTLADAIRFWLEWSRVGGRLPLNLGSFTWN